DILNVWGTGTSTFANGITLTTGCIVDATGNCVGGTPGGSDAQIQYNNGGTAFGGATNFVFDDVNTRVGLGTSTPGALFSLASLTTNTNADFLLSGINMVYASSSTTTIPTGLVNAWSVSTSTTITPFLSINSNSGNVGVGTANPSGVLHAVHADVNTVALFERSQQTSDGGLRAARLLSTKTTDMGDGFGPLLGFNIQDDAGVINPIVDIGAVRAGADTTGDLVFRLASSGAFSERMRITSAGNVGIDDTTPAAKLSVGDDADSQIFLNVATDPGWTQEAIQLGARGSLYSYLGGSEMVLGRNVYNDGDDRRIDGTTEPTRMLFTYSGNQGYIYFSRSSASTAGSLITWTNTVIIGPGVQVGSPTDGDKGAGTLNAVAVYDDGTLLADWVFDIYYDGQPKPDDPYYKGQSLYSLSEVEEFAKTERHLPWMISRSDFEAKRSLGNLVTQIWQGQEQQQLYLFDHEKRIKELENKYASSTLSVDSSTSGVSPSTPDVFPPTNAWSIDQQSGKVNVTFFGDLNLNGNSILNVSKILGMDGKWSIDETGKLVVKEIETEKITTKELCVDDVCVTRERFKEIFGAATTAEIATSTPE
ncbi:MAG: hypothetical protein HYW91_02040, partial [Candidatus Sungbacteria bacterium]|nr:hypothetical protein [Candidatus Sungbacteria bacterium]